MICRICTEDKPPEGFPLDRHLKQGRKSSCKVCYRIIQRQYYNKNKERIRAKRKPHQYELKYRYGISTDEYQELLDKQKKVCAICKKTCSTERRLAVDHNHKNKQVRGLLCSNCNTGIGKFKESPELLREAILYLENV